MTKAMKLAGLAVAAVLLGAQAWAGAPDNSDLNGKDIKQVLADIKASPAPNSVQAAAANPSVGLHIVTIRTVQADQYYKGNPPKLSPGELARFLDLARSMENDSQLALQVGHFTKHTLSLQGNDWTAPQGSFKLVSMPTSFIMDIYVGSIGLVDSEYKYSFEISARDGVVNLKNSHIRGEVGELNALGNSLPQAFDKEAKFWTDYAAKLLPVESRVNRLAISKMASKDVSLKASYCADDDDCCAGSSGYDCQYYCSADIAQCQPKGGAGPDCVGTGGRCSSFSDCCNTADICNSNHRCE